MESNRETKTLTVGAHTIVVKTYLTGREARSIMNALVSELDLKYRDGEPEIEGLKGDLMAKKDDRTIEAIVFSVDGQTDNVLDRILDAEASVYNAVIAYANEILEKKEAASSATQ